MAAYDIMPWKSPLGGTYEVRYGAVTAAQTFQVGEPVAIVEAGTLTEPPQDATEFLVADADTVGNRVGIACFGPGAASAAADPTSQVWIDPRTGAAYATGAQIAYWPADQGTLFITNNVHATAGAASAGAAPVLDQIGEIFQITYGTYGTPDGGWGIEYTAGVPGTDVFATVIDVLDATFVPIGTSANVGVWVVFEMKTAQ